MLSRLASCEDPDERDELTLSLHGMLPDIITNEKGVGATQILSSSIISVGSATLIGKAIRGRDKSTIRLFLSCLNGMIGIYSGIGRTLLKEGPFGDEASRWPSLQPTRSIRPAEDLFSGAELAAQAGVLRTFLHVLGCLGVTADYSNIRTPNRDDLTKLSGVSPVCADMVTAYSELQAVGSRSRPNED